MMKFPKPRVLEENLYPDLNATQPELLHNLVHNFIHPPDNSPMDSYLKNTIQYLKDLQKSKGTVKINNYSVGSNLFFTNVTINQNSEVIPFLIDTGATNSLLHSSIARNLKLKIIPIQLTLSTATGQDQNAIKGFSHITLFFQDKNKQKVPCCTTVLISDKLNGLKAILGAEFLLNPEKVKNISSSKIKILENNEISSIPIYRGMPSGAKLNEITINNILTQSSAIKNTTSAQACQHIVDTHTSVNITFPIKHDMKYETLPPSQHMFNDSYELDYKMLEEQYSIYDGNFSQCPQIMKEKLLNLLEQFSDRFSVSKLDIEKTDLYESELNTTPSKIINQPVKRLPQSKIGRAHV